MESMQFHVIYRLYIKWQSEMGVVKTLKNVSPLSTRSFISSSMTLFV